METISPSLPFPHGLSTREDIAWQSSSSLWCYEQHSFAVWGAHAHRQRPKTDERFSSSNLYQAGSQCWIRHSNERTHKSLSDKTTYNVDIHTVRARSCQCCNKGWRGHLVRLNWGGNKSGTSSFTSCNSFFSMERQERERRPGVKIEKASRGGMQWANRRQWCLG